MQWVRIGAFAWLLVLAPTAVAEAQASTDSAPPPPSPAFSWPEVKGFSATFALGGLAYLADQGARDAVRASGPQGSAALDGLTAYGNAFGQPGVVVAGVLLYGGGLVAKRPVVASTGFRALEAIAVSGVVTSGLKGILGRARPAVAPDAPDDWQFARGMRVKGGDYQSMPSGHSTAAFAFATAVTLDVRRRAPQHARWVGALSYASALSTAYARMHDDRHWLSDVTVGAGIGIVTAMAIDRWHATRRDDPIDGFFLRPLIAASPHGGAMLGVSIHTR
ncbi:MAG: phosphatase PAP2 family protein [Gemmatimonadaceae bacterium]|nr:phosphatase PAP2 family protein [Gemmatimonadaceae bacterium]MCW5826908.1 phosphatase PAP2 family protein [Gemmatimonadaceae bacterium]